LDRLFVVSWRRPFLLVCLVVLAFPCFLVDLLALAFFVVCLVVLAFPCFLVDLLALALLRWPFLAFLSVY
jgi:hypothetical protein